MFDHKSFRSIQAISCHYAASECNYVDCEGVQEWISKEVTAVFKKRTGIEDAQYQVRKTVVQMKHGTQKLIKRFLIILGCLAHEKSTCRR